MKMGRGLTHLVPKGLLEQASPATQCPLSPLLAVARQPRGQLRPEIKLKQFTAETTETAEITFNYFFSVFSACSAVKIVVTINYRNTDGTRADAAEALSRRFPFPVSTESRSR